MGSLIDVLKLETLAEARLRCPGLLLKNQPCSLCTENCPLSAIHIEGREIVVDKEKCVNCGICTLVCPFDFFNVVRSAAEDVLNKVKNAKIKPSRLAFLCCQNKRSYEINGAISFVSCIYSLSSELLFALAVEGVREIVLDDTACSDCSNSPPKELLEKTLLSARKLCEVFGVEAQISLASSNFEEGTEEKSKEYKEVIYDLESEKASRKEFLQTAWRKMLETAVTLISNTDQAEKKLKKNVRDELERYKTLPPTRRILLKALQAAEILPLEVDAGLIPLHQIVVMESCEICEACSIFCPTSALGKKGGKKLVFEMQNCVGCGFCISACPKKAVSFALTVNLPLLNKKVELISIAPKNYSYKSSAGIS